MNLTNCFECGFPQRWTRFESFHQVPTLTFYAFADEEKLSHFISSRNECGWAFDDEKVYKPIELERVIKFALVSPHNLQNCVGFPNRMIWMNKARAKFDSTSTTRNVNLLGRGTTMLCGRGKRRISIMLALICATTVAKNVQTWSEALSSRLIFSANMRDSSISPTFFLRSHAKGEF